METEIVFYIGVVLFVLLGPWIMLIRANARRKREHEENHARWTDLNSRVQGLEHAVEKLRREGPVAAPMEAPVTARFESPAPAIPPPAVIQPPPPKPHETEPAPPPLTSSDAWVADGPVEVVAPPSALAQPQAGTTAPSTPNFTAAVEAGPSLFDRFKSALDIEEMLGTNWLNKLGIILLVLGIAFFLAYQLKTMGPAGKVLVGFITSGVILGAGIWFDRGEKYRILARAAIGGGWALLFFTTYAMYHVPAAQVLTSQVADLVLMLAVAACMVAHTLRYKSQVVTGLAFLLAFLTIAIHHSNVYSLIAGGVLAAGLVFIVGRMQWFELEVVGILASYLNHYLWLRPIIEPMHGHRHPFPEFAASAAILTLYWVIFRASYVFRKPSSERQEHVSTAAALLNTSLLLVLFKYQSTHPEWAFWALLGIGAIETALGQLPITRRRRNAFIVLSTLGVVLLLAAFPFRSSGTSLSVLWLADAEILLLIGVWTREVVFRRLGMLASVLAAGQMLSADAAAILGRRMDDADLSPNFALAIVFVVAAAVFYLNAHWILRRWGNLFEREFDRTVMQRMSYVGMVMLLTAAWIAFPESWTAVAWCVVGLALAIAARRFGASELRYQSAFLGVASVFRVLAINLEETATYHGFTVRLVSMALVAILLYVTSRWIVPDEAASGTVGSHLFAKMVDHGYTWSASILLGLLAWYELRPAGVADAWVIGGLILLEVGLARKNTGLRLQGYAGLLSGFLRIFFVNLNAEGLPGQISPRFYTVVPVALAFFYAYWRLHASAEDLRGVERKFRIADVTCWLGTISVAALMRFELAADWVATAWAALAFVLLALAWRSERRVFLYQALLVAAGVLFRTGLHNLYQRSYFPASGWESRWITSGTVVALLLASLPIAFKVRRKNQESAHTGILHLVEAIGHRPEQIFFFIAVGLLTALLTVEMRHGMVTLSWGVEGVMVFLLALWLGERSFRLTGLGLLLLCVGKILVDDVWQLNPRDRYLTFIVLGAALLLVSFLYTRNRERLRQYL